MSFMDKINEMKDGVLKQYGKIANKTLMEGTMAGLALVTNANGVVKDEEMQLMIGMISRDEDLKVYDIADMLEVFKARMEGFKLSPILGETECLAEVGKLKKKADQATVLVGKCCAIGASDGDFDANENAVVTKMCVALGLSPAQFDL